MELGIIASDDSATDRYEYLSANICNKIAFVFHYSNVYWIDTAVPLEKFLNLKSYQVSIFIRAIYLPLNYHVPLSRGLITFQGWERSLEKIP